MPTLTWTTSRSRQVALGSSCFSGGRRSLSTRRACSSIVSVSSCRGATSLVSESASFRKSGTTTLNARFARLNETSDVDKTAWPAHDPEPAVLVLRMIIDIVPRRTNEDALFPHGNERGVRFRAQGTGAKSSAVDRGNNVQAGQAFHGRHVRYVARSDLRPAHDTPASRFKLGRQEGQVDQRIDAVPMSSA